MFLLLQSFDVIYQENDLADKGSFAPPLPGTNRSVSADAPGGCPCNKILISSLGQAQQVQPGKTRLSRSYLSRSSVVMLITSAYVDIGRHQEMVQGVDA